MHNVEEYKTVSEIRYAIDNAIKYYDNIYNPDKNGFDERYFSKIKFFN